jgi:nitroreductase
MNLDEAIYTTRAMRRVKPDPIPDDVLGRMFDAAVRGPSGGNTQLFRFLLVTDPETKAKIGPIYRTCLDELNATQYAGVLEKAADGDPDDPGVAQTNRINASSQHFAAHLEEHPLLIFVFGKERGETSTFPCIWNMCLAARAEGVGTFITTLLKLASQEVEDILGVPKDNVWHMHGMIPVGYPTGRWGLAKRKPAHLSVFSESWDNPVAWEVPEPLWQPDY